MTYTHCQNCGTRKPESPFAKCPQCGWRPGDGLKWHDGVRDPERAKACYDACQDVPTEFLTPGYVKRLLDAYDALQLKVDVRERRVVR